MMTRMKPITTTYICTDLNALVNGCVVQYRRKLYWLSAGLDGRILTDENGVWQFIKNVKWKTCTVVFFPTKG
jgi:hypothetical protein